MTAPLREAPHLVARFFDVLSARALRPAEQAEVAGWLRSDGERAMFWQQPRADQRHGLAAARHVAARAGDRPELVRAALLHDVGKRHARLGVIGRVVASLVRAFRLRAGGRIRSYIDHGALAAAELEAAGAEPLVVDYARHHHGARPASIPVDDWTLLGMADRARR